MAGVFSIKVTTNVSLFNFCCIVFFAERPPATSERLFMSTVAHSLTQRPTGDEIANAAERLLLVLERDPHYKEPFEAFLRFSGCSSRSDTERVAEAIMMEALNFLYAAAQPGSHRMVPNRLVDAAWHTLILDTKLYARICRMYGAEFIHHNPDPKTSGWDKPSALEATVERMNALGLGPDEAIWGVGSAQYCSDHEPEPTKPERCSSCSSGTVHAEASYCCADGRGGD